VPAFVLLAAVFPATCSFAAPTERARTVREATGIEWLEMSGYQRQDEILKSMAVLVQSGVEPMRQPHEYYSQIHAKLRRDPNLYGVPLSQILAACVYEDEPAARAALDALRKKA